MITIFLRLRRFLNKEPPLEKGRLLEDIQTGSRQEQRLGVSPPLL
ncbi:hypothetical protein [Pseudobacillus wudalianchiensis]|nr:hypothetical protein [Bacillus wudalianchiensis]